MLVQVHLERVALVRRDVVDEFLFEDLGVFLVEFGPQFVAVLDLAAHRGAVDGDADAIALAGLVDVVALLLDALELADALGLLAVEGDDVSVVLEGAGEDLDADDRRVVLAEGVIGKDLEPAGARDVLQDGLLLGLLALLDELLVLLDQSVDHVALEDPNVV